MMEQSIRILLMLHIEWDFRAGYSINENFTVGGVTYNNKIKRKLKNVSAFDLLFKINVVMF